MQTTLQTRNETYFKNIEKLSLRRKTVYNLIKKYGELTAQEITVKMVFIKTVKKNGKAKRIFGINNVSGRLTELSNLFLIKSIGVKLNEKTQCPNTIWQITTPDEQIDSVNKEYVKLTEQKDKLVNDYHLLLSDLSKDLIEKRVKVLNNKIKALETVIII